MIKTKRYIAIDLQKRKQAGLSLNEWILLEQIQFLSIKTGWCFAKRSVLADTIDITVRGLRDMISRLENSEYLIKSQENDLQVTDKWLDLISNNQEEVSSPSENQERKSVPPKEEVSSPQRGSQFPSSIHEERKIREKDKREKKYIKKDFKFSLKKETSYENLSSEYKEKLKAKIILTDADFERYSDFILSLGAKGYKYKNFYLAYLKWNKERTNKILEDEPILGEDWKKFSYKENNEQKVIAINKKTLEIRQGIIKHSQNEPINKNIIQDKGSDIKSLKTQNRDVSNLIQKSLGRYGD